MSLSVKVFQREQPPRLRLLDLASRNAADHNGGLDFALRSLFPSGAFGHGILLGAVCILLYGETHTCTQAPCHVSMPFDCDFTGTLCGLLR